MFKQNPYNPCQLFHARRVTEAHGGYLTASSPGSQGSIFTMVLPRA